VGAQARPRHVFKTQNGNFVIKFIDGKKKV
jgi:hypothetical protein